MSPTLSTTAARLRQLTAHCDSIGKSIADVVEETLAARFGALPTTQRERDRARRVALRVKVPQPKMINERIAAHIFPAASPSMLGGKGATPVETPRMVPVRRQPASSTKVDYAQPADGALDYRRVTF